MIDQQVLNLIDSIPSIDLNELEKVTFEQRQDTKYVFNKEKLTPFLNTIKSNIHVLEVNGKKSFHYSNIYYDTKNMMLYKWHHAGRLNRIKVRRRKYDVDGPTFLEVKKKNSKSQTVKFRKKLEVSDIRILENQQFVKENSKIDFSKLSHETYIEYDRITIADNQFTEKLTLDLNLSVFEKGDKKQFSDLVIAELKQSRASNKSILGKALKNQKIYKSSFSKYCWAVINNQINIKKNRFKPLIKKISNL